MGAIYTRMVLRASKFMHTHTQDNICTHCFHKWLWLCAGIIDERGPFVSSSFFPSYVFCGLFSVKSVLFLKPNIATQIWLKGLYTVCHTPQSVWDRRGRADKKDPTILPTI